MRKQSTVSGRVERRLQLQLVLRSNPATILIFSSRTGSVIPTQSEDGQGSEFMFLT